MAWVAFSLGLLGSVHCIGMCGPLALGLTHSFGQAPQSKLGEVLQYNLGRIMMYGLIGLVFGFFGTILLMSGIQKSFSILLGVLFITLFFFSADIDKRFNVWVPFRYIKNSIAHFLTKLYQYSNKYPPLVLGAANGLLPCGLVYLALAGSLVTGNPGGGLYFMVLFGLGTSPAMILLVLGYRLVNPSFSQRYRKVLPVVHLVFGMYLIYRGIVIDIPAELDFWEAIKNPVMCH